MSTSSGNSNNWGSNWGVLAPFAYLVTTAGALFQGGKQGLGLAGESAKQGIIAHGASSGDGVVRGFVELGNRVLASAAILVIGPLFFVDTQKSSFKTLLGAMGVGVVSIGGFMMLTYFIKPSSDYATGGVIK